MFFGDMPTSAVAYCRVSSAAQEERETIQNQIDFAQSYCKLNNIAFDCIKHLIPVFTHVGGEPPN